MEKRNNEIENFTLPIIGQGEDGERIFQHSALYTETNEKGKYFNYYDSFDERRRNNVIKHNKAVEEFNKRMQNSKIEYVPYDEYEEWAGLKPRQKEITISHEIEDSSMKTSIEENMTDSTESEFDINQEMNSSTEGEAQKEKFEIRKEFLRPNLVPWEKWIVYDSKDIPKVLKNIENEYKSLNIIDQETGIPTVSSYGLIDDDWMKKVAWDGKMPSNWEPKMIYDLNDKNMVFRLNDMKYYPLVKNAAATIILPENNKQEEFEDKINLDNIYKGMLWSPEGEKICVETFEKEKESEMDTFANFNSIPARTLATIPLNMNDLDAYNWRHGTSKFYPITYTNDNKDLKLTDTEKIDLTFQSVTGRVATLIKSFTDFKEISLLTAFLQVSGKAFPEAGKIIPSFMNNKTMMYLDKNVMIDELIPNEDGKLRKILIWIIYDKVEFIKDKATSIFPLGSEIPSKPPGGFAKKRHLTCLKGHTIIFEYLEKNPLLLNYPGMGLQLRTWIMEIKDDQRLNEIKNELRNKELWKVGYQKYNTDKSLFIGQIKNDVVFSVECNLFRAPACGYDPDKSHFLLIRSASGSYKLRNITGTILVGQQQPLHVIPNPVSSASKDYQEKRLIAHVLRKLNKKTNKESKSDAKVTSTTIIRLDELIKLFPNVSESIIKARLKDKCQCVPVKGKDRCYMLKPGSNIPTIKEIEDVITPEYVCAYDSMREYRQRMRKCNLRHFEELAGVSMEKWKLALEMLPDEKKEIAVYILNLVQNTPWNQSEGYHKWQSDKGQIAVSGIGDWSKLGLCCSFLKDNRRKNEIETKMPVLPITGTSADLRRLSAEKAVEALKGLPEAYQKDINFETFKDMERWDIINIVRNIATAAVTDGIAISSNLAQFARNPHSSSQITNAISRKIDLVFEKQVNFIEGKLEDKDLNDSETKSEINLNEEQHISGNTSFRRKIILPDGRTYEKRISQDNYGLIQWKIKEKLQSKEIIIESRQIEEEEEEEMTEDQNMNNAILIKLKFM